MIKSVNNFDHGDVMRFFCAFLFLVWSASAAAAQTPVDTDSVEAGTEVMMRGEPVELADGKLHLGVYFPKLLEGSGIELPLEKKVTVISIVPSLETPVCDLQTHELGETELPGSIARVTISKDSREVQEKFARESGMDNIRYYSENETNLFGTRSGLLIPEKNILTRAVIVLDSNGLVRYLQIVPEVSHLPDMEKALGFAEALATFKSNAR